MTPDELPADMEGRLRMRLNDLAALGSMKITTAPGERIVILDVVQGTRALLKAYQEQRRALEIIAESHDAGRHDGLPEACPAHDADTMFAIARAALNQKGDER
jgi:hypothetical protein